ncbi:MAG: hypothetical protein ABJF11_14260 [Reichenbachiella sp.]|uniref:hypothetical protein n=1 Tax=Reichenbachiella sp. TaxID=2184521 RepID=UPI0032641B74
MEQLSQSWLTDESIDFELKKYKLLAYLQQVQRKFNNHKLYPAFSDLVTHFNNLLLLRDNKELLFENFPKVPSGIDIKKLQITYDAMIEDDQLMREISDIIHYALPQFDQSIHRGKELFEFVEEHLSFDEIGLLPIYQNEGYVMVTAEADRKVEIYRYKISLIDHYLSELRSIDTYLVCREVKSVSNTFNKIKLNLSKRYFDLPNPATFLVVSKLNFPIEETLMPIAKRLLLRHVDVV